MGGAVGTEYYNSFDDYGTNGGNTSGNRVRVSMVPGSYDPRMDTARSRTVVRNRAPLGYDREWVDDSYSTSYYDRDVQDALRPTQTVTNITNRRRVTSTHYPERVTVYSTSGPRVGRTSFGSTAPVATIRDDADVIALDRPTHAVLTPGHRGSINARVTSGGRRRDFVIQDDRHNYDRYDDGHRYNNATRVGGGYDYTTRGRMSRREYNRNRVNNDLQSRPWGNNALGTGYMNEDLGYNRTRGQPGHIPGYGGHVKGAKFRFGATFGQTSADAAVDEEFRRSYRDSRGGYHYRSDPYAATIPANTSYYNNVAY